MLSKFSDHSFLKFRPSIITSAAIAASRLRLHLCPSWTPLLIKVTSYTWEQIAPCVSIMLRYICTLHSLVYYAVMFCMHPLWSGEVAVFAKVIIILLIISYSVAHDWYCTKDVHLEEVSVVLP